MIINTANVTKTSWVGVISLGLLTITSYGSWLYGFGVLINPINQTMGWSTTALGLTYGIAQSISGIGAFFGGRLLDRLGLKAPLSLLALLGGGLMMAAFSAESIFTFGLFYATGAGITGATGFYHITTVASARRHPQRPDRAIAILTIVGAFCSPIYLPLTAWLVENQGWRITGRILAALAIAGALQAMVLASGGRSIQSRPSARPLEALRKSLENPQVRRMLIAYVFAGMAVSTTLVYQVPILTAGGLTIGTAGVVGGLRGFCQIFGRMGLTTAVERHGTIKLLRSAYLLSALGVALLLFGALPTGVAYSVLAGIGIGASSPLQAMYARTNFAEGDLGLLMGLQGAAVGLASGIGPIIGGILHDQTNTWVPTLFMISFALVASNLMLRSQRKTLKTKLKPTIVAKNS